MLPKIVGALFGILGLGALAIFVVFYMTLPSVSALSTASLEPTAARLERGRYLAYSVTACVACHSERDYGKFGAPIVLGSEGRGGERFGREEGFPGEMYASNITPGALSEWTDGEVVRAITEGVSRDGQVLFPLMAYTQYRSLCDEDLASIVTWMRALPAIAVEYPQTEIDFPVSMFIRFVPNPREPRPCLGPGDGTAYGEYLATIAACANCHTQQERGLPVPGMGYAGGFAFPMKTGTVRSSNLTPDRDSGIGDWDRARFIDRFKAYSSSTATTIVGTRDMGTPMPWQLYAQMSAEDLGSIFDYLRTVPAVSHHFERFKPRP